MRGKLPNFYPGGIMRYNISSTEGICNILRWLINVVRKRSALGKHTATVEDIAVHRLFVRIFYNVALPPALARDFKQDLACIFAIWHIGKMLFKKVWERHLLTLIGPAYKFLFPARSQTCVSFAKMQTQLAFLTDLILAYDAERKAFLDLYAKHGRKSLVRHTQQCFEFFIPLVSIVLHLHSSHLPLGYVHSVSYIHLVF